MFYSDEQVFLLKIHIILLNNVPIHFFVILHIEKIKNNSRDIDPQNGKKFDRTQAEFKKGCLL